MVSQGSGREWLEANAKDEPKLMLLDYQPYEQLPDMLASADVLLVILEGDASRFSVPSKALNYMCAGRPILGLLPEDNAVALMVESAEAGFVVAPGDLSAATAALDKLLAEPGLRRDMGMAARRYAEEVFDIGEVGNRFESVIRDAAGDN